MAVEPRAEVLAGCALFGGLPHEFCGYFAERLEPVELVAGQVVYDEGDPAHEMYMVASGQLSVYKPSQSANTPLAVLNPGEFFGDMSFIDMQPRSATVRANEPTVLWRLNFSTLREAYLRDLKCYSLVIMNIAREMSRRLRRADAFAQAFTTKRLPQARAGRPGAAGVIGKIGMRSLTTRNAG